MNRGTPSQLSLRRLALEAGRLGGGLLAPRGREALFGTARRVGYRDYSPGDDLRLVDWHVCARHDELVVKQYAGAADRTVRLLLDRSRSMALGSPTKLEAAVRIAAALGYLALGRGDGVCLETFSDRPEASTPTVRGTDGYARWGRILQQVAESDRRTDLARVAGAVADRNRRQEMIVLVSDLCDGPGWRKALEILCRDGRDPRLVHLVDSADAEPPAPGDVELVDAETGAVWQTTLTKKHAADYRRRFQQFLASVRRWCDAHGVLRVQLDCRLPPAELLSRAVLAGK